MGHDVTVCTFDASMVQSVMAQIKSYVAVPNGSSSMRVAYDMAHGFSQNSEVSLHQ